MTIQEAKDIRLADYLQSLGYHPAKQQGNSLWYNSPFREEVSVSAILSCRPFFILIFLLCIKMKHYGFSRKSIWKNLETFP